MIGEGRILHLADDLVARRIVDRPVDEVDTRHVRERRKLVERSLEIVEPANRCEPDAIHETFPSRVVDAILNADRPRLVAVCERGEEFTGVIDAPLQKSTSESPPEKFGVDRPFDVAPLRDHVGGQENRPHGTDDSTVHFENSTIARHRRER